MRKHIAVLVMVACSLGSAAAQFPGRVGDIFNRGRDKAKQVADINQPWTPEQEHAIGRASAAKVIHIFRLYDRDPALTKYINLVGNAAARHATRTDVKYHFAILDTEIVNAFSMPGGYVFITRGALANMTDESQLAGALAHEVAHVDKRHLEREVRAKKTTGLVTSSALDLAPNEIPGQSQLKEIATNVITTAFTMHYSRDKEAEADSDGLQLAAAAGYDAMGLPNFLSVLAEAEAEGGNQQRLGLWGSTHPPFAERVKNLTALAGRYHGGQMLADRFAATVKFPGAADAKGTGQK